MRSPLILVALCAAVLGGAYLVSRGLVSEVSDPVQPVLLPTVLPEPAERPQTPDIEEARRAMLAPRQGPLQHVNNPAPLPRMEPNAPPPVADLAPSPFEGESKELDYAEALLAETNPGVDRLQSAHQVLSRCVEQAPENARCQAALALAQTRLGTKAATERPPAKPTLLSPAPNRPGPR